MRMSAAARALMARNLDPAHPLYAMVETIPTDGWTREERDRFMATFVVLLDYCIAVEPVPAGTPTPTGGS